MIERSSLWHFKAYNASSFQNVENALHYLSELSVEKVYITEFAKY